MHVSCNYRLQLRHQLDLFVRRDSVFVSFRGKSVEELSLAPKNLTSFKEN